MEVPELGADEIIAEYERRKSWLEPRRRSMMRIAALYNNEVDVPLAELDEAEKPATVNVLGLGVDHYSQRMASTMPVLVTPAAKPGVKTSEEKARVRRQALMAWQESSMLDIVLEKRAKELLGFSLSVTEIRWSPDDGHPKWHWRNPFHCFPPPMVGLGMLKPHDMIYAYQIPVPQVLGMFGPDAVPWAAGLSRNAWLEMIEYSSARERVFVVREMSAPVEHSSGEEYDVPQPYYSDTPTKPKHAIVSRAPNPLGRCPATMVERIGLTGSRGKFDALEGLFMMQAKMMALHVIATERSVFPDTWLESRESERGTVTVEADGPSGQIGEVSGGVLKMLQSHPGFQGMELIDNLERNMRVESGVSPEFGGESPTNVRTARRGSAVLNESVSYELMAMQRIMAKALAAECELALEIDKEFSGRHKRKLWSLSGGLVEYTPASDFDHTKVGVRYPMPGADSAESVVAAGQRMGMGTLSKRTMMELDPMVPDPEIEADRIIHERLEDSMLGALTQQGQAGTIPAVDMARIMKMVREDKKDLVDAIVKVDREARERQSTEVPPGDPGAQPGLAEPGMGAEQPVEGALAAAAPGPGTSPAAAPPPAGPPALADLLGAL
ncbi:MAG: hypothetical protein OXG69_14755 [bacterium]|nr:hypothetical protein [bacterium]